MGLFLKVLGLVDMVAVLAILAASILPQKVMIYCAGYLIAKGGLFAFTGNIISILDVVCGIFIILLAFDISFSHVNLLVLFFLIQKAFFSFL